MRSSARFDAQAPSFDARAGVPPEARAAIAEAVVGFVEHPMRAALLEIGAGTGQIGVELATRVARYVALDGSAAMLAEFRERAPSAELVVGDAAEPWPVDAVDVVFGSRSLHLLPLEHVVAELARVVGAGGCVLAGRVIHEGPQAELREELGKRVPGQRPGHERVGELLAACARRGWEPIEERIVARWTRAWKPVDSLGVWAGRHPEAIAALTIWARDRFGDLDVARDSVQAYALQGARCPRASF